MIVQTNNVINIRKIYTNKTTDGQSPASVVVEQSGLYQVAIFAFEEGKGILDSRVEYTKVVRVMNGASRKGMY